VSAEARKQGRDEEAFGEEQVPTSPRERILELVVTVLLSSAVFLSAWCAYEATRFTGHQGDLNNEGAALRIESAKADSRAGQLELSDAAAFSQYLGAIGMKNSALARFYEERFRDEFRRAFEAWLALKPFSNSNAPKTPFVLSAYRLASQERADTLAAEAEERTLEGQHAGAAGDRYVLAVVLLAAALFLLGVQTRMGEFWLRAAMVSVAGLLILGTLVWILTLPRLFSY
jgi:hypothetical protein